MYNYVLRVAVGLEESLESGRSAVKHIVGRDPDGLNEAGVARATIESAAENFSDGVVAPVFFYVLFGLPGIFAYKAINTLDSMIGYKSDKYRAFGWAAARLDDVANWPAARLSGLAFIAASFFIHDACAGKAFQAMMRDAGIPPSPIPVWPGPALAGPRGLALPGPRGAGPGAPGRRDREGQREGRRGVRGAARWRPDRTRRFCRRRTVGAKQLEADLPFSWLSTVEVIKIKYK